LGLGLLLFNWEQG